MEQPVGDLKVNRNRFNCQILGTSALGPAYDGAMESVRFAVLDVEMTSGDPTEGRIMEVAVLALDGKKERIRWDSLVQPRRSVPPFIRRLTGINDDMLRDAPVFVDVVRTLETLTQDRIVVGHNVRFDITAIAHEFARTGLVLERATLCTEKLSRRLVAGLPHYNLGSLCRHFGIPYQAAHRAMNDAEATALLLGRLTDVFGSEAVLASVSWVPAAKRA